MADVSVDATISTATARGMRALVFPTASIGYAFYIDSDGVFGYSKTTNGGTSWGAQVNVDGAAATTVVAFDVWFDKWTPGDTGTLIHTWWFDVTNDIVRWRTLDTNGDTLGTVRTVFTGASAVAGRGAFVSGTKTASGYLYCAYDIDAGAERGLHRSVDSGTTWSANLATTFVEATLDTCKLFPAQGTGDNNDCWALYYDASATALTLKLWDSSGAVQAESATIQTHTDGTTDLTGQFGYDAMVRHSDGHLIIATVSLRDNASSTHQVFDVTDTSTVATKTAITTNIDDHYYPQLFIDQNTDDLYVAYNGKRDGTEVLDTTTKVYYTKSTDGGTTWTAGDTAYMEGATAIVQQAWSPLSGGRFGVMWRVAGTLNFNKVNSVAALSVRVNDTITVTESANPALTPLRVQVSDMLTITESVTPVLSEARLKVSAADTLTITESAAFTTSPILLNVSEAITVADRLMRRHSIRATENAHLGTSWTPGADLLSSSNFSSVADGFSQSFTASRAGTAARAWLWLTRTGSPTGDLYVEIVTGSVNGTVIATSSLVAVTQVLLNTNGINRFDFPSPPSLVQGTQYWLRLWRTGTMDISNTVSWYYHAANSPIEETHRHLVSTGLWTASAFGDFFFTVDGPGSGSLFVEDVVNAALTPTAIRVSDVITVTESVTAVLSGALPLPVSVSDAITVTDYARVTAGLRVQVAEPQAATFGPSRYTSWTALPGHEVAGGYVGQSADLGTFELWAFRLLITRTASADLSLFLELQFYHPTGAGPFNGSSASSVLVPLASLPLDTGDGQPPDRLTTFDFAWPNDYTSGHTVVPVGGAVSTFAVVALLPPSTDGSPIPGGQFKIYGSPDNPYADGTAYTRAGGVWTAVPGTDLFFEVVTEQPSIFARDRLIPRPRLVGRALERAVVDQQPFIQSYTDYLPDLTLRSADGFIWYDNFGQPSYLSVIGQSFTLAATRAVRTITLYLTQSYGDLATDAVFLTLRTGGVLGTVIATSSQVAAADLPPFPVSEELDLSTPVAFEFDSPVTLTSGVVYSIQVERTVPTEAEFYNFWVWDGFWPFEDPPAWLNGVYWADAEDDEHYWLGFALYESGTTIRVRESVKAVVSPLAVHASDAITVTDNATRVITPLVVRAADAITVTELRRVGNNLGKVVNDAVVITEARRVGLNLGKVVGDVITVTELRRVGLNLGKVVADTVTVTELRRVGNNLGLVKSETISVLDARRVGLNLGKVVSEAITATDSATRVITPLTVRVHEAITVNELVTPLLIDVGALVLAVSDTVTITESVKAVVTPLAVHAADAITLAESTKAVVTPLAVHAAETITVTEARTAQCNVVRLTVLVADAITTSESVKPVIPVLSGRAIETVTVAELLTAMVTPLVAVVSDDVTVTEAVEPFLFTPPTGLEVADTITVTDAVVGALTPIVHFVTVDIRAGGSQVRLQGSLSGRVGSGTLRRVPSLAGTLENLTTPVADDAAGLLRELQHGGGTLRRLPFGLTVRAVDTSTVVDHVEVEMLGLVVRPVETVAVAEAVVVELI